MTVGHSRPFTFGNCILSIGFSLIQTLLAIWALRSPAIRYKIGRGLSAAELQRLSDALIWKVLLILA